MTEAGQTRIQNRFQACAREGRAALVTFVTAGDPDFETSSAILAALPAAGADVIELGVPFTDPMADGVPVQLAGQRALKAGQTLRKTLAMVEGFRKAALPKIEVFRPSVSPEPLYDPSLPNAAEWAAIVTDDPLY